MFTRFFAKLTRENWGFPWHLIIAQNATLFAMSLIYYIFPSGSFTVPAVIVAITINVIGVSYEIHQIKADPGVKRDSLQDTIANNIGITLGLLFCWLIQKALLN
jgi:hypothetical protein